MRGASFAEVPWRTISVRGADAEAWLHDLVTADVEGLGVGESRRSLLLTPTGRIRADFHVARTSDGSFLLLQATEQPEAVDEMLAPYVLSSEVQLEDTSERLMIVAVLGGEAAEDGHDLGGEAAEDGHDDLVLTPSVLGVGHDVVVARGEPARALLGRLRERGLGAATTGDVETWRVRQGIPRMGPDFGAGALPAEAGLESAIDLTKGCFLGQESVAKVRNLGHPPRVLLSGRAEAGIRPGAAVLSDGEFVGTVTSVAETNGDTYAIVRVRWDAASGPLATEAGPLSLRRRE